MKRQWLPSQRTSSILRFEMLSFSLLSNNFLERTNFMGLSGERGLIRSFSLHPRWSDC
ncbi:unnamed protein product [Tuber aestivum]|uniref:Uncharacterized protein n=1 Tax=Tuber aestivum TaxID=59557 RepID=A0A292PML6_9PEZI|nr:unnamed protein product [Tuber aestivum]